MSNEIQKSVEQKMVDYSGYSSEQIAVIKATVAKNTTNTELMYFMSVCQAVELNPFLKEIWCYKDNKGNLLVFAGRDGFLKKAQQNPFFNGIRSAEVRANDKFSINIAENKIIHEVVEWGEKRGEIKGAYAIVYRKDGEPTIAMADFERYNKGYNTWKSHPEAMIKKVAEVMALKLAFGMSAVQSEHEFDTDSGIAIPRGPNGGDFIGDIKMAREEFEAELSTDDWFKKVCYEEIGKARPETKGEHAQIRKAVIEQNKYDLRTGEKLSLLIQVKEHEEAELPMGDL